MADDIVELGRSIARIEALLKNMPTQAELVRVEERAAAAKSTADNFITLKQYHNDLLENRVRVVEESIASINVKLAPMGDLLNRVRVIESSIVSINTKLVLIGSVGILSFGGVVTLLVRMFEAAIK